MRYDALDVDPDRLRVVTERNRRLKLGSGQYLARILNSDAHTIAAVGRNANRDQRITRYKMEAPTFEGLRLALRTADTRVRIEKGLPNIVPSAKGVVFQGGFMDGQAVNFSPNLTCIIGGRGSGKSTASESVCLIGGSSSEDVIVIDSDVWPIIISLSYLDETGHLHNLARSKYGGIENLDDPVSGAAIFPIECYRQGATNEISKRVQDDPLALLTFLDRLIQAEQKIEEEDKVREALIDIAPKIAEAAANVGKIPDFERELKLKSDQLLRLREDRGEEIIKLQQQLESEKRARAAIVGSLGRLMGAVSDEVIVEITNGIQSTLDDSVIEVGAPEATKIKVDTGAFAGVVTGSTSTLNKATTDFIAQLKVQVAAWQAKESQTSNQIDQKKQELLQHGIWLDMPFIQKLVSDEARAKENVKNLKTWVPELARLRQEHTGLAVTPDIHSAEARVGG
ncbi:MAG: hypothetical protein KJZ85_03920 [Rhodobacteraceae bacterium]|nr:hypothetical protein [Paracoccaceae bacterium]